MAAMAMPSFHIGIEFEVLVLPHADKELRPWPPETHETKVKRLVDSLNIELETADATWPGLEEDYTKSGPRQRIKWAAVPDSTVESDFDAPRNTFGVEFVTPVLEFAPGSPIREHLRLFWRALHSLCDVTTNESCGTHIHLSLNKDVRGGGWSLDQLKAVARSWLYFERAFSALGPPLRFRSLYARRLLVHNAGLAGCSLTTCFAQIDVAPSINQLVAIMCDTSLGKILEHGTRCHQRDWALSFLNAADAQGYLGTLEFRRPPGVRSYEECLPWVELFVGFVQGALCRGTLDEDGLLAFTQDVRGLEQFLVPVQGFSELDRVEVLTWVPEAFR